MAESTPPSIYDLPPLETGGSRNREGLAFQDHVAMGFCLDMLKDERLAEVWCETQDDITLLWRNSGDTTAEFAQAKSDAFNQLWSISKLCQREGASIGTSIIERSIAYDRCLESTLFRIVTARPFNGELEVLTWERGCSARAAAKEKLRLIQDEFHKRVGGYVSDKGTDSREWAKRALLDARHSGDAVASGNLRKLRRALENYGFIALEDQTEEIYAQIVAKIAGASRLDARFEGPQKRFTRERFEALLKATAEGYLRAAAPGGGKVLQTKMEAADLPADTIALAQELRRAYRRRSLLPKYQSPQDRPLLDEEVAAILHALKAKLDSGILPDDGPHFLDLCLENLANLRNSLPQGERPSLADLQGSMYLIADRCLHRFRRAAP